MTPLPHKLRRGYTLIEILVVVSIIVLMIAMSVPLFGIFTGARSVESAQNQIGSLLNAARNEAISMQRVTGVMFYLEPTNPDRVSVTTVFAADPLATDNTTAEVYLDLHSDSEPVILPAGISVQTLCGGTYGTSERYLGYNKFTNNLVGGDETKTQVGGVILFDSHGHIINLTYAFRTRANNTTFSEMGKLLYNVTATSAPALPAKDMVPRLTPSNAILLSQVGLVAFEEQKVRNLPFYTIDDPFVQNGATNPNEFTDATNKRQDEEDWIDDNAIPFLINRFNGTLIRGGD